jgi:hypothetical protein
MNVSWQVIGAVDVGLARADAANAPDAQSLDANGATAALDEAKAQAAAASIADPTRWIDFYKHSRRVTNFRILK